MTPPLYLVYITSLHLILTVFGRGNAIHEQSLKVEIIKDKKKKKEVGYKF